MDRQKELIFDFANKFRQGRINRRQLLHSLTVIGALGAAKAFAPPLVGSASAQTAPKRGGTLVAVTIDKPVNMDPAFAELYSSMQVYQNVFSRLVEVDVKNQIIPSLASAWRQIDDSTWEFDLVDNAWFHNDEKFSSADVKYSFDRMADPKLAAANYVFFKPLLGVEVVSPTKVRFIVKPNWGGLLLTLAAAGEIVNQKAIESNDPKLMPIGTGPYKFMEWVKDDHITLERWDKYFVPGKPYLDKIIFKAIADDTVRLTGLQTGEFDWIEQVPLHRVDELKGDTRIKANPNGFYFPDILYLNASKAPFDKLAVRQAMQLAVPRETIAKVVWHGQALPSAEPVAPSNVWYSGEFAFPKSPDIDKARELLTSAGVEGDLAINFAGQPQVPTQLLTGQVMQQQLKQIGVNLNIQSFESARWFEELVTLKYQMTGSYWSATLDPIAHCLGPNIHSKSPWNSTGFGNAELDTAIDAYDYTIDPEERKKSYANIMKLTQIQSPILFVCNFNRTYWTKTNVHGVETVPGLNLVMENVWIDA